MKTAESDNHETKLIYSTEYAKRYSDLYIENAMYKPKHTKNLCNLGRINRVLQPSSTDTWLDLFCGQAWHFAKAEWPGKLLGCDSSVHQIQQARARAPHAQFVESDVMSLRLQPASVQLITCFWGSYGYLGNAYSLRELFSNIHNWLSPSGALYMDILDPAELLSYNSCSQAVGAGFSVTALNADCTQWNFSDIGGQHFLFTPPISFFIDILTPNFDEISIERDSMRFSHHLTAFRSSSTRP